MDSLTEGIDQASTPKKRRLSRMNSQEEMMAQTKNENREGETQRAAALSECTLQPCLNAQCSFLKGILVSFSLSVETLEPHDVSE